MAFDFTGGHAFHTHEGNIVGGGYAIKKPYSVKVPGNKKVSDNFENYVIPIGLSNNIIELNNPFHVEKHIEVGPLPENLYDKLMNLVNIEKKEEEKEEDEKEKEKEKEEKEKEEEEKEEEKPEKKKLNKTKPAKKSKQKKTKKHRS